MRQQRLTYRIYITYQQLRCFLSVRMIKSRFQWHQIKRITTHKISSALSCDQRLRQTSLVKGRVHQNKTEVTLPQSNDAKLKRFHEKLHQYNLELAQKSNGDSDFNLKSGVTQWRYTNSIEQNFFEPRTIDRSNSFVVFENTTRAQSALPKFDILTVPEYADEIFKNEKLKERMGMPNSEYMLYQNDINEKMRRILVDWLLKVHGKFKLLPETFSLTINIIDRYLSQEIISRK